MPPGVSRPLNSCLNPVKREDNRSRETQARPADLSEFQKPYPDSGISRGG